MWIQSEREDIPRIIGHRGASANAPENTLAAFRLAAAMGADAVELDVQLTGDKKLVVFHDDVLDRTTNGSGCISEYTFADLKKLDAGSHFHPMFAGERIPELDEVFVEFQGGLLVNVELKSIRPERELVEKTYQCIAEHHMQYNVLVSSFNPFLLLAAHRIEPEIPLGLLVTRGIGKLGRFLLRRIFPHQAYHPEESLVSLALINRQHHKGTEVNCWTVNDTDRIKQLGAWKIDGIITNHPDLARKALVTAGT
ncbi:MAG: hypothetical protein JXA25_07600 [Anaerolineales bacterium]|nr:hypothetical protein [Anaerolineales bacterium]